ncbi:MAG: hypothetical protein M1826_001264 [Phylliscum demangeonii]|nr:MAG: hypothetical protein M1826_001264 [Phylliscum demangeonii]
MAPSATAADDHHQPLLDSLDMSQKPRPFRHGHWKPAARRNKTIKQILTDASRKEASLAAANTATATPHQNSGVSTPHPPAPASAPALQTLTALALTDPVPPRQQEQGVVGGGPAVVVATYTNIESAPSLLPSRLKHYCDITGLPAPYTDPKTRLRYHNQEVFAVVRGLGQGVAEKYLETRGAHTVLR